MSRAWLLPIVIAGLIAAIVALLGFTVAEVGPWYHSLAKPRWAPADAAYGVAWTAVYSFTAIAGVTAWLATPTRREREWLIAMFALNGFLNILWSLIFFRFHRPDWAVIEVLALWLSVGALIVMIWRRSMAGALLLLPYLMWVTFIGYLNSIIVSLNRPFF